MKRLSMQQLVLVKIKFILTCKSCASDSVNCHILWKRARTRLRLRIFWCWTFLFQWLLGARCLWASMELGSWQKRSLLRSLMRPMLRSSLCLRRTQPLFLTTPLILGMTRLFKLRNQQARWHLIWLILISGRHWLRMQSAFWQIFYHLTVSARRLLLLARSLRCWSTSSSKISMSALACRQKNSKASSIYWEIKLFRLKLTMTTLRLRKISSRRLNSYASTVESLRMIASDLLHMNKALLRLRMK